MIPCGLVARIAGFHPAGPGSIPGMGKSFLSLLFCVCSCTYSNKRGITHTFQTWHPFSVDEVAEWLRRWTANPMCSARVGSNPILVGPLFFIA